MDRKFLQESIHKAMEPQKLYESTSKKRTVGSKSNVNRLKAKRHLRKVNESLKSTRKSNRNMKVSNKVLYESIKKARRRKQLYEALTNVKKNKIKH